MRTYIIPYTLSDNKLKSIYLKNDLRHLCYFVDDSETDGDAFSFIVEELGITKKNYNRITYIEDFSFDSYLLDEFECVMVDVSKMKINDFIVKNNLAEHKSFDVVRTDNTILLAILMKFIFHKSLQSIETEKEMPKI